jgi:hypothetical protein
MDLDTTTPPIQLVVCPELSCQAPAAVTDRFVLDSTSGKVEHVKTLCLNGHGLTPRTESVRSWPVSEAAQPPRGAGA